MSSVKICRKCGYGSPEGEYCPNDGTRLQKIGIDEKVWANLNDAQKQDLINTYGRDGDSAKRKSEKSPWQLLKGSEDTNGYEEYIMQKAGKYMNAMKTESGRKKLASTVYLSATLLALFAVVAVGEVLRIAFISAAQSGGVSVGAWISFVLAIAAMSGVAIITLRIGRILSSVVLSIPAQMSAAQTNNQRTSLPPANAHSGDKALPDAKPESAHANTAQNKDVRKEGADQKSNASKASEQKPAKQQAQSNQNTTDPALNNPSAPQDSAKPNPSAGGDAQETVVAPKQSKSGTNAQKHSAPEKGSAQGNASANPAQHKPPRRAPSTKHAQKIDNKHAQNTQQNAQNVQNREKVDRLQLPLS